MTGSAYSGAADPALRVHKDRILFALEQAVSQTFSALLACAIVAWTLGSSGATFQGVVLWLGATWTGYLMRRRRLERLRQFLQGSDRSFSDLPRRVSAAYHEYIVWTWGVGLVVSVCPVLFFQQVSTAAQVLVSTVLCGWVAASMAVLGIFPMVFIGYTMLFAGGVVAGWAANGFPHVTAMMLVEVAFLAVMWRLSRDFSRRLTEGLQIRLENEALIISAEQARKHADEANAAKSRFLAVASHDLRQPVHALSLLNGLLAHVNTVPKARELATQMAQSIGALDHLFTAVLDFSKLEASAVTVELQWVRLPLLVERCVQVMRAQAEAKGLTIGSRVANVELLTDALLLERVLRNLIDNAIKYTTAGAINVEAVATPRGLQLTVADTGCGIPVNVRQHVFKEYYQGPSARQFPGLGLGLAIVRRLCGLLGVAELYATDNDPQGSRFILIVPPESYRDAPDEDDTAPLPLESVQPLSGMSVLCVDDDNLSLEALDQLLRAWGCKTYVAGSPEHALHLAGLVGRVDAVLSDQDVGRDTTGVDLIGRLREVLGEVPAALVTGDAQIVEAARRGDVEFPVLTKPVKPDDLRAMLQVFRSIDD